MCGAFAQLMKVFHVFTGDLDANRPVPFRLTPNIAEFLTTTGVNGPLTASMVAAARCFVQPQYKLPSFLRAIFRDEYITWHKKVNSINHIALRMAKTLWSFGRSEFIRVEVITKCQFSLADF